MKKLNFSILFCFFSISMLNAQSKFTFGLKGGAQYVDPKLYEFNDPFPFYKYDQITTSLYGETGAISGAILGVFCQYPLLKSKRLIANIDVVFNRKGYYQQDATKNALQSRFFIKKNYLDIPLSILIQPFKKSGFFIEPGINQAFLLSKKTYFPPTNNTSSEFEKRRERALLRETNLTGFRIGAGWDFKRFDLAGYYQTDKQYEYIQGALRYKLSKQMISKP